jgi:hypothetical protein
VIVFFFDWLILGSTAYKSEFSVVSYAHIIESKPNDMSTVFTTMKRCVDMTKAMGQVLTDVATFLVSLVFGFGGNETASSDKSDLKLSENDFIKSFSLHQLKKADNHDTLNASLQR